MRWEVTCDVVWIMLGVVGLWSRPAMGYAEEPVLFVDPITGEVGGVEVSTVHFELTYALALAAGFTVAQAVELQIWNQLVDSEHLETATSSYSACDGVLPLDPDPNALCPPGTDTSQQAWPLWDLVSDTGCSSSRFGPFSPFFHFPHDQWDELGAIHDWGWGDTGELWGYAAYAWGALTVLSAPCTHTQPMVIETGLQAGSLRAFAVYLHCLGDAFSHRDCLAQLDAQGAPWGTHTLVSGTAPECTYNPAAPDNDDAHGREFGPVSMSDDTLRTDEAIRAIYSELVLRSQLEEGVFDPLTLDDTLLAMDGQPTLDEALLYFVHQWRFDSTANPGQFAMNRRQFALSVAQAIIEQRLSEIRPLWPQVDVLTFSTLASFPGNVPENHAEMVSGEVRASSEPRSESAGTSVSGSRGR